MGRPALSHVIRSREPQHRSLNRKGRRPRAVIMASARQLRSACAAQAAAESSDSRQATHVNSDVKQDECTWFRPPDVVQTDSRMSRRLNKCLSASASWQNRPLRRRLTVHEHVVQQLRCGSQRAASAVNQTQRPADARSDARHRGRSVLSGGRERHSGHDADTEPRSHETNDRRNMMDLAKPARTRGRPREFTPRAQVPSAVSPLVVVRLRTQD